MTDEKGNIASFDAFWVCDENKTFQLHFLLAPAPIKLE
jgi:hypothetical protein